MMSDFPDTGPHARGETTGTPERPAQRLAAPVLTFDLPAELAQLRGEPAWARGDRNAKTLVKEPDFRLVLVALKAGARLEEHLAPGRISIQTLEGQLRLRVAGEEVVLPAGHLVSLERDVPHDVEAEGESAFLLTIAWAGGRAAAV
jgi:quercetin dioxygenase-like cupin family protein